MKKTQVKSNTKEKIIKLPVSKYINLKYREYAIYTIESRGIPNFFDGLTPVQRFILKNASTTYSKTVAVIGSSMTDHYVHGDAALAKAICKLARPYGNAVQILEGYGFFGNEVSPTPAAPRYTSVRLSSAASSILNKYSYLTTREPEGPYHPFWMDIPLGLTIPIVGIAVGYKTMVLPRKLKDIQEFLEGKRKNLKPYFKGFNGTIEKYKKLDNAWLITSNIKIEERKINVKEIPPILKYTSVLKKLDYLFNKFEGNIRIVDNSNTKVDVSIIYTGKIKSEWEEIVNYVKRIFSIIVSESVIFTKDKQILTYDSIEDYLNDYKWQIVRLKYRNTEYEKNDLNKELKYNEAKELFITFILAKKRTNDELTIWLKKYNKDIVERLERLTSRKFTTDELNVTKQEIKKIKRDLKEKEKEYLNAKKAFEKYPDPTLSHSLKSKKSTVDLFETSDITESDGIIIWKGEDALDEEIGKNDIDDSE